MRSYVAQSNQRSQGPLTPDKIGWAIQVVSRRVPRASCLTQALAAQMILARYGYNSQLRVGVTRESPDGFRAHAWVESDGKIIVGAGELSDLTLLPDLGQALE